MTVIEEAIKAIDKINEDIYECTGELDFYCNLEVVTDTIGVAVKFGDYTLWDNENDEREWSEDGDVQEYQEPLEEYLRKELRKFLKVMRSIEV